MGVAGLFFEPQPPNLARIHFFNICNNAEILVMISQLVSDLPKISVSVLSISRGVFALGYSRSKTYLSPSANLCKMHIKDVNDETNDKTFGLSTHSFSSVVLFLFTMS